MNGEYSQVVLRNVTQYGEFAIIVNVNSAAAFAIFMFTPIHVLAWII